jgi:hypothetical protein
MSRVLLRGGNNMKKIVFLGWLVLLSPIIVYAQEKIEAPVWNVGDRWVYSNGTVRVVTDVDENSYTVKGGFGKGDKEFSMVIFEKSTLKRLYYVQGGKRKNYEGVFRSGLNFPFSIGKTWKDKVPPLLETYAVLGWEDVVVQGGKFRALKLEFNAEVIGRNILGKSLYWYSPDVKNIVKHQFEDGRLWTRDEGSELTSFELKK